MGSQSPHIRISKGIFLNKLLNLKGSLVVADALSCQKETAKEIVTGEADYFLSVKNNQEKDENNIKRSLSYIMLDCLIDPANLIPLLVGVG